MLEVRTAGSQDVPAIGALRRSWSEEQAGTPIDDAGFEDELADWFERERHQRVTWLAEVDGRPVGMLNLLVFTRMPRPRSDGSPRSGQWGYVANVYVEAALRNAGVGQRLLDAVLSYADEQRFVRLVLAPSDRSVPFYARAGFVPATSLLVREGG